MIRRLKNLYSRLFPVSYKNVFSGMLDAMAVFDDRGRLLHLNPSAENLFGRKSADAAGERLETLFADYDELLGLFNQSEGLAEISFQTGQEIAHYEAHITQWRNRRQKICG